jgi:hypothetical protein
LTPRKWGYQRKRKEGGPNYLSGTGPYQSAADSPKQPNVQLQPADEKQKRNANRTQKLEL